MKVGDYVRTKDGRIGKIIDINLGDFQTRYELDNSDNFHYEYKNDIIKSSPNIIDLIEVGDFINRECVLEITEKEKTPGFKRYFVTWRCAVYGERIEEYELKRILETIVTKEQFEAMEYKCE